MNKESEVDFEVVSNEIFRIARLLSFEKRSVY